MKEYQHKVEMLLNIFTVIDGELRILLCRKKEEPYKGYWMIPSKMVSISNNFALVKKKILEDCVIDAELSSFHSAVYDDVDRIPDDRVIGISEVILMDSVTINLKQGVYSTEEMNWFSVWQLPKLAFDHEKVISDSIETVKRLSLEKGNLKLLYPSDFSLPELQKYYESIYGIEFDRRNFRKKFIVQNLIEPTGEKTEGLTGRPAKLYRFKFDID